MALGRNEGGKRAMGLTLHLLRHAKSSWKDPGQRDHDRPLNGRGRDAASTIGAFLAREGPVPDVVLCSSAVRTRETWERVARALPETPELRVDADLYLASPTTLLDRIRDQADGGARCLLVVAHNPGTEELARQLAGSGDEEAWHRLRAKYPTAGLATLRFATESWREIVGGDGELVRFVVPRELEDE